MATEASAKAAELENAARTLTEQLYANGKFEQKDINYGQIDPKWREAIGPRKRMGIRTLPSYA